MASVALLVGLTACDGDSPEEVVEDSTEGRGWAAGPPGLFGFREPPRETASAPLGQIGYAPGSQAATGTPGTRVFDATRVAPGWNLMSSGDAAAAELVSLEGEVVHRWALPYDELPGAPKLEGPHQIPWRRVALARDGGLFAIHSGRALVHLDKDSALRWSTFDRAHHDLALQADGGVLTLLRGERMVKEVNPDEAIVDDRIASYGPTGELRFELSLWSAFLASPWAAMAERLTVRTGDVMHANSLELLDEAAARALDIDGVQAGQVLVCMRDLDLIGTVDLERGKFTWLSSGPAGSPWRGPHDPTVLPDGNILIFDNLGGPAGDSRLLTMDPAAGHARWQWTGTPSRRFSSLFCGTAQSLPGGTILATESCRGRAFEIDPRTAEIVWEHVSDRVAGEDDQFVAALFAVERIPGPLNWLRTEADGR